MVIFPSRGVSWQRAGSLKRYKQRNEITYERRPLTKRELEIFMIVMMIDGLLFWRSDTCCNVVYPHLHGVHDFRFFFFCLWWLLPLPGWQYYFAHNGLQSVAVCHMAPCLAPMESRLFESGLCLRYFG